MTVTLAKFTPLEESLFLTLYARALDSRRPRPILGDTMADRIVRGTDHDYDQFRLDTNFILTVAARAKKLDESAGAFVARHPDAVGIDLGAGFDTRAGRLDLPPTADWYDVDFPAVAAAREGLIDRRPNTHVIAADVRGDDWLEAIPRGRPAVIVADGMMAFLSQDELTSLWNRLIDHFPTGEIVFNSYTRFAIWLARHARGTKSVADLVKFPGMDDPRLPESWNPRLKLVREIVLSRDPQIEEFPPVWRGLHHLLARSDRLSRTGTIVAHYRF